MPFSMSPSLGTTVTSGEITDATITADDLATGSLTAADAAADLATQAELDNIAGGITPWQTVISPRSTNIPAGTTAATYIIAQSGAIIAVAGANSAQGSFRLDPADWPT